jgi:RNA 3'-terminal phosphate cyclase (ATP)
MVPSLDFVEHAFVPALRRMGINVTIDLDQHGFNPIGGGRWKVTVEPWNSRTLYTVLERGVMERFSAVAKSAHVPHHVGEREMAQVAKDLGWPEADLESHQVESPGPGNIVSIRLAFKNVTEVVEALGEKRRSAERVARKATDAVKRYLTSDHPVGAYLADQLMLLMALGAGGEFRTASLSEHARTNAIVIQQLLPGVTFELLEDDTGATVRVHAQQPGS